jgi:hypothetical protein
MAFTSLAVGAPVAEHQDYSLDTEVINLFLL